MRTKHLAALVVAALLGVAGTFTLLSRPAVAAPLPPLSAFTQVSTGVNRQTNEKEILMALNGRPTYLGRISATTSAKNNADATAFSIPPEVKLLLVCVSAAVRILPDTDVTEDITTATGVPVEAGKCWWMFMADTDRYLQAITETSTSNVDVWRLD